MLVGVALAMLVPWERFLPELASRAVLLLAPRLGLGEAFRPDGASGAVTGRIDGVPVRIARLPGIQPPAFRISARGTSSGVQIEGGAARRRAHARVIAIGNPVFDEAFTVRGEEGTARALLDAPTRDLLMDARRRGAVSIGHGAVEVDVPWQALVPGGARLRAIVDQVVALARALADPPANPWGRVAAHAEEDPDPGVRLAAMAAIARRTGADPARFVRDLQHDAGAGERLDAAILLGDAGHLRAVASDDGVHPVLRGRALLHLVRLDRGEGTVQLLARLVGHPDPTLYRAAWVAVEVLPAPIVVEGMVGAVERSLEWEIADREDFELAARVFGRLGTGAVIQLLLRMIRLQRAEQAAFEALGAVGTLDTIPPLQELAGRAHPARTRNGAREAIRRIQEREGHVQPGAVSLCAGEDLEGALSVASEPGRISLADSPGRK